MQASASPAAPARRDAHPCRRSKSRFPTSDAGRPATRGIPYVWTFAGNGAGPHVLVQALTHGNEVCGAIALDWLLGEEFRPRARHADDVLRQRRRVPALRPGRSVRLALRRRGFQPAVDGRSAGRPAQERRPRPRARVASALRPRRLSARSPFDDRPLPAARDGRPAAQGCRARAGARVAGAHHRRRRPRGRQDGCATTRSSTIPRIRAMRC